MNRKSKEKCKNPIRPGPYYDGIKQIKMKYRLAPLALAVIWHAWACLMAAMTLHWTNWAITGINLQSVNSRHCLTLDTAWRSVTQAEGRGTQVKKCLIQVDSWWCLVFIFTQLDTCCLQVFFVLLLYSWNRLTLSAPPHPLSLAGTAFEWEPGGADFACKPANCARCCVRHTPTCQRWNIWQRGWQLTAALQQMYYW